MCRLFEVVVVEAVGEGVRSFHTLYLLNIRPKFFDVSIIFSNLSLNKTKQSRRDTKIYLMRQFFETSGPKVYFFRKKIFNIIMGSVCNKCQFSILFRLVGVKGSVMPNRPQLFFSPSAPVIFSTRPM